MYAKIALKRTNIMSYCTEKSPISDIDNKIEQFEANKDSNN